jgi:hypothetical protein
MKKITTTLLFCGIILSSVLFAQSTGGAAATFDRNEHNFGTIREEMGTIATQFEFTNTGTVPLIIQRISAPCGCTTPRYPREPILPGKTGRITVEYHAMGRPGAFNRPVHIFTNVPDTVFTLNVRGVVTPRQQQQ